jgi:hypothetical protein
MSLSQTTAHFAQHAFYLAHVVIAKLLHTFARHALALPHLKFAKRFPSLYGWAPVRSFQLYAGDSR